MGDQLVCLPHDHKRSLVIRVTTKSQMVERYPKMFDSGFNVESKLERDQGTEDLWSLRECPGCRL